MNSSKGPDLRLVDPPAEAPKLADGVHWDKPAPTAPPSPLHRKVPKHLLKVEEFLRGIVADEAFLLDLCVDRATEIVNLNCQKRMVGIDLIGAEGQMHPFNVVAAASPLAVELYREALKAVEARQPEYEAILAAAKEELDRGGKPALILPH